MLPSGGEMRWLAVALWLVSACDGGRITLDDEGDTAETGASEPRDRDLDGYTDAIDCDDRDAAVNPGAEETCNGRDDDCDDLTDEGFGATYYADLDGDGYGTAATTTVACAPPTGFVTNALDCNDSNPAVHPGASELCDTVDQDCDGFVDEGVTSTYYRDADGDGYGTPSVTIQACAVPTGYVTNTQDCNDADPSVKPGGTEACNGVDDDCDGSVDEGTSGTTWYRDADGDGYGTTTSTTTSCSKPSGYVADSTDCDDSRASVNPGAIEACNGVDDDCDGAVDDASGTWTWYRDADADGYGDASTTKTTTTCSAPTGYVADSTDCDDTSASIHPGATELCNGIDDDCDGTADDGSTTWFLDADADGYGTSAASVVSCTKPTGYVSNASDCNDSSSAIYPGAPEICNGTDEDCDGTIDEGVTSTYYRDADGDSYGVLSVTTVGCSPPSGYVTNSTDCDDTNVTVNPGATESCNSRDDDCDGSVDEGVKITYYRDGDSDGYGDLTSTSSGCTPPTGYVGDSRDCNDANNAIHPGATETCNGFDDDCDGTIDEGCS